MLRGARQVGKTTLIRDFAKTYKYGIILNLEKLNDRSYFDDFDDVQTILEALFLAYSIPSSAISNTLLFIDEIQESPKAIQLLRYFYEEIPDLHVISAGSLLEFAMQKVHSFPVGRVDFLYLHPLNFQEYL
ncbi:AAA family ATPase [Pedobacter cryoconitis]|uniref:AAA family ATPase n=1 Tax=Pedobacter cryoconitis TaxID=188932 RepID=UPI00288C03C9|nr:AAA family ATPase [Pedobacter cryoconitis]